MFLRGSKMITSQVFNCQANAKLVSFLDLGLGIRKAFVDMLNGLWLHSELLLEGVHYKVFERGDTILMGFRIKG